MPRARNPLLGNVSSNSEREPKEIVIEPIQTGSGAVFEAVKQPSGIAQDVFPSGKDEGFSVISNFIGKPPSFFEAPLVQKFEPTEGPKQIPDNTSPSEIVNQLQPEYKGKGPFSQNENSGFFFWESSLNDAGPSEIDTSFNTYLPAAKPVVNVNLDSPSLKNTVDNKPNSFIPTPIPNNSQVGNNSQVASESSNPNSKVMDDFEQGLLGMLGAQNYSDPLSDSLVETGGSSGGVNNEQKPSQDFLSTYGLPLAFAAILGVLAFS